MQSIQKHVVQTNRKEHKRDIYGFFFSQNSNAVVEKAKHTANSSCFN